MVRDTHFYIIQETLKLSEEEATSLYDEMSKHILNKAHTSTEPNSEVWGHCWNVATFMVAFDDWSLDKWKLFVDDPREYVMWQYMLTRPDNGY